MWRTSSSNKQQCAARLALLRRTFRFSRGMVNITLALMTKYLFNCGEIRLNSIGPSSNGLLMAPQTLNLKGDYK